MKFNVYQAGGGYPKVVEGSRVHTTEDGTLEVQDERGSALAAFAVGSWRYVMPAGATGEDGNASR